MKNLKLNLVSLKEFEKSDVQAAISDWLGSDLNSLEFPYRCNNNCSFCLEDKTFSENNINEILDRNVSPDQNIIICTGEPTLYKELSKLIKKLKNKPCKISLATNGRRLKYLAYTKQLEKDVNEFLISLHAPIGKVHDKLTRTPGSFKETVTGIKVLKSLHAGDKIRINFVVNKENINLMKDMLIFLKKLDVKRLSFDTIVPINNGDKNYAQLMPPYTKIYESFVRCSDFLKRNQGYKNFKITLSGIPPCLIKDDKIPFIFYDSKEFENLKIKQISCSKCSRKNCCKGIWKAYIKLYGWEEFNFK